MTVNTYVIASQKRWNAALANRLEKRTGHRFIVINDENRLNHDFLLECNPRYVFFPHWSSRINSNIWQNHECIIFHMTDLPYGRGGSPLQNLIIRGKKDTMISAIRCVEALDAGACYLKKKLELHGSAEEIFFRADLIIEEMIIEIIQNKIQPVEQVGEPTLFQRRKPHESNLEDLKSLQEMYDFIRMLDAEGYPHAFLDTKHFRLEFQQAQLVEDQVEAKVCIKLKKLQE